MTAISREVIKDPVHAYGFAMLNNVRLPNSEEYIIKNPKIAKWYAEDVIKGSWPEAGIK